MQSLEEVLDPRFTHSCRKSVGGSRCRASLLLVRLLAKLMHVVFQPRHTDSYGLLTSSVLMGDGYFFNQENYLLFQCTKKKK